MWLPLTFLALLSLSPCISAIKSCSTVTFELSKDEKSCLSAAVFLNPAQFVQSNRTCYFYDVCTGRKTGMAGSSQSEETKELDFRVSEKRSTFTIKRKIVSNRVMRHEFVLRCPIYENVKSDKEILLLRTHGASKVSPYNLLKSGKYNSFQMSVKAANRNRTVNFKSNLLQTDRYRSQLGSVRVEMLRGGTSVASLGFEFRSTDRLETGEWFAQKRLISSKPWNFKRMRSLKFNYFSLKGFKSGRAIRRFYINTKFGGCSYDQGFFAVIEKPYCSYEKNTPHNPAYLYSISKGNVGRWAINAYFATEFRIYGVYKTNHAMFVRRSQMC